MAEPFAEALELQGAAAVEGFDWDRSAALWEKLYEEVEELRAASRPSHRQEELGDLLFMVVNIARHLELDPKAALSAANAKFRRRYAHVRAGLAQLPPLGDRDRLTQMERLWQDAKKLEKTLGTGDSCD